jgi:hypothetical protein
MTVVPTVGMEIRRASASGEFLGVEETASDTYALANLGVGLVFNSRMALTPMVAIPFGLEGSDALFGVAFSMHFGR